MRHAIFAFSWRVFVVSVRKRAWFTSIQISCKAEELAQGADQAGSVQYRAAARAALAEALRVFQDKKADKRAADAAALTLKKYPPQEAWIVDYATNEGRHIKTFAKKKEADEFAATARVEVRHGVHTPSSKSITVAEAGKLWLATAEKNKLER